MTSASAAEGSPCSATQSLHAISPDGTVIVFLSTPVCARRTEPPSTPALNPASSPSEALILAASMASAEESVQVRMVSPAFSDAVSTSTVAAGSTESDNAVMPPSPSLDVVPAPKDMVANVTGDDDALRTATPPAIASDDG